MLIIFCVSNISTSFHHNIKYSANIVKTKYGPLRGIIVHNDPVVEAYLGVPYASPPVGSLRFMPPVTPSTWRVIRLANRYSSVCPQTLPTLPDGPEALLEVPRGRLAQLRRLLPLLSNQSEDCLYLNLYVPRTNHPGSMTSSSNNFDIYDLLYCSFGRPQFRSALQCVNESIASIAGVKLIGDINDSNYKVSTVDTNKKINNEKQNDKSSENSRIKLLPVIVYIHGESYEWNSGNPYDGSVLAARGNVIVITINFRLGILGFLKTGGRGSAQGNFGLMDLVAGLHWLKENLPAFGGDPNKITIMGQGTGAALANILVVSPSASDLINRAVLLSGSALSPWAIQKDPLFVKRRVAEQTGCHGNLLLDDLAPCLRTKSIEELLTVKIDSPRFLPGFAPFIDGTVIVNPSSINSKKLLILPAGSTISSTSGIELADFPSRELIFGLTTIESYLDFNAQDLEFGFNETKRDRLFRTFVRNVYHYHLNEIYAVLKNEYTDWERAVRNPMGSRDASLEFLSDGHTAAPLIRLAYLHSLRGGKSYFLHFKHQSNERGFPQRSGSVHGEDVPFYLGLPISPLFSHNYTSQDYKISILLLRYLSNFASTGNPNDTPLSQHDTTHHIFHEKSEHINPPLKLSSTSINLPTLSSSRSILPSPTLTSAASRLLRSLQYSFSSDKMLALVNSHKLQTDTSTKSLSYLKRHEINDTLQRPKRKIFKFSERKHYVNNRYDSKFLQRQKYLFEKLHNHNTGKQTNFYLADQGINERKARIQNRYHLRNENYNHEKELEEESNEEESDEKEFERIDDDDELRAKKQNTGEDIFGNEHTVDMDKFKDIVVTRLPFWDTYDSVNQLYLELGTKAETRNHYRGHKLSMWLSLIPQLHSPIDLNELPVRHHHFAEENIQFYDGIVRPQIVQKPDFPKSTVQEHSGHQSPTHQTLTTKTNFIRKTSIGISLSTTECPPNSTILPTMAATRPENHWQTGSSFSGIMSPPVGISEGVNKFDNTNLLRRLANTQYQSYTTALMVTIGVGCFLLLLNIVIFAGIYYQREKRANDARKKVELQSENKCVDLQSRKSSLKEQTNSNESGSSGEYSYFEEKHALTDISSVELPLKEYKYSSPLVQSKSSGSSSKISAALCPTTDQKCNVQFDANKIEYSCPKQQPSNSSSSGFVTYQPCKSRLHQHQIQHQHKLQQMSSTTSAEFCNQSTQSEQPDLHDVGTSVDEKVISINFNPVYKSDLSVRNDSSSNTPVSKYKINQSENDIDNNKINSDIPRPPPPPKSSVPCQGGILRQPGPPMTPGSGKKRVQIQEISV